MKLTTQQNAGIAGLLVIGAIIGALIAFSVSSAVRPVKTVTKTHAVTKIVKIENGEPLANVVKVLGAPEATVQSPSASNNQVGCLGWASNAQGHITQAGDWTLILCGKVQ